jgi:hypothetical protein
MSVDLSYWGKFNPNVAYEITQKQFFGKYVIRVTYNVPSALFIGKAEDKQTMQEYIDWRQVQAVTRTGGIGLYNSYWTRDITPNTDAAMLEHFRTLRKTHKLKFRVEASSYSVYANDEAELKKFNDAVLPQYQYTLSEISSPKDAAHCALLEAGHITGTNKKGYKYKVTLRDGKYDAYAKQQLMSYFDSLGDVVSVSKSVRRSLVNGHSYTYGIYIYTTDPSILTFVDLIIPGLVNKTYEITKI